MAKQMTITLREYVYEQVFPKGNVIINKTARLEELVVKGLRLESELENENKE